MLREILVCIVHVRVRVRVRVRACRSSAPVSEKEISDNLAVNSLIRAYQVRCVSSADFSCVARDLSM